MSFFSSLRSDASHTLHELKISAVAVEKVLEKVLADPKVQKAIEGVSASVFGPSSAIVEAAVFNVAGEILKLLQSADSIKNIKSLEDLGFDKEILAEFHELVASIKKI
jgi:hypothetical protein